MDKRIAELKEQIIKENIEKIATLSKTGAIEFNINDNIVVDPSFKDISLTKIISDGKKIFLISTHTITKLEDVIDIRLMGLEEIDYNVTCVLDELIKNMRYQNK